MQLERRNLEVDYYVDMITNNGFKIEKEDRFAPTNIDAMINSEKYMDTEFRCDCGAFMGRNLVGQRCPRCGSEITLRSLNFEYTGWIDLHNHKVMTPVYYEKVKRVIGPNMLRYILGDYKADNKVKYNENDTTFGVEKKKKRAGKLAANDLSTIKKKIAKNKYYLEGLGHDAFYKDFENILLACVPPSHREDEEVKALINEKSSVFTSKIPVYSTAFRPITKTSETMFYPQINKQFSGISSIQTRLDDMFLDFEIRQALNDIQKKWNEASENSLVNEMSKKTGFIRSEIIGGTYNFSGRGVVTLDPSLRGDEVDLPYTMFIYAFQFRITHLIAIRYNMTLERAYLFVSTYPEDPTVQTIAQELVNEHQWIIILREPTNNLGSIELCRVRGIKLKDDTISLPIEPLQAWNADFDGDQLNLMFVPNELVPIFERFHYSYMTDYVNGTIQFGLREWCHIPAGRISR